MDPPTARSRPAPDAGRRAVLRELYEDVLGARDVDQHEGFFVLGGSSLLVEVLLERVAERTGVVVPLEGFYADPTLAGLRALVAGAEAGRGDPPPGRFDLPSALAAAAAPDPSRPAVTGPDGELSYAEVRDLAAAAHEAAVRAGVDGRGAEPRGLPVPTSVAGARAVLTALAGRVPLLLLDPRAPEPERRRAEELFTGEARPGGLLADRAAVLGYATSGSTGRPKVVLVPLDGTLENRAAQAADLGLGPADRLLLTAPLHLGYGLGAGLLAGLLGGAGVVLPPVPLTPAGLRGCAERHPVTVTVGVGLAYRLLLASGAALPALRHAVVGGEPLPPALAREWADRVGVPLSDAYGASEVGHVSSVAAAPGTAGRPLPGVRLRVRDPGGPPRETGTGELLVSSPALALGYAGEPEQTTARFHAGWFATGDLAELRADGHLVLRGRLDDQLTVGGSTVDPREVEEACREALGLADCAVVGVPLASGRTEVCAYVVADRPVGRADVVQALAGRISAHKIPSRVVQLEALPRGPQGKLARAELPR
ncbi:AMP-binding protein [Geodermatophilus sp. SYSU D00758]